jgi:hypothetical protein
LEETAVETPAQVTFEDAERTVNWHSTTAMSTASLHGPRPFREEISEMTVGWSRALIVVAAVLALGLSFALGYVVRNSQPIGLTVYTASGQVGADGASFQVGDTTYGFESSVAWTDAAGAEHESGWPDCLPKLQSVQGVRFGGAVVWHGDQGLAQVLWVDCRA